MGGHLERQFERILAIDWSHRRGGSRSQEALVREYLRRAAWWGKTLQAPGWPFIDPAEALAPDVPAPAELMDRLFQDEHFLNRGLHEVKSCARSLRLAAVRDAGRPVPPFPDLFEPIIVLFERGGGFSLDKSRMMHAGGAAFHIGIRTGHLHKKPGIPLDPKSLDALDA
ncbi:hypothetical protein [Nocardiopsis composta]|uniref:Uncharacterized protein n=1 Tax=Nocardiopsis composta TaxID=157465 RepID=A0A7W8QQQ2_9ACTN|nr:hypothetical protein [Nocardiopsis composta]MBB5434175.1 hypothetical protein [Nocardiopsis composta]